MQATARKAYTRGLVTSPNWLQDFFRRYTFLALLALSVVAGIMFGATVAYQASMTQEAAEVSALANFRPNLVTRVLADDGQTVIGEFSLERRIPISYKQIPERMRQAIFAIEDDRFYQHIGIDPIRVASAAYKNVMSGRKAEGGSTLTQQLARALFLSPEKTYTRKVREILVAMQIERYYSKEQILELYCNQIFLGGGSYGFEAAARHYFSKPLTECNLEECALLAGLPQAPSLYSPTRDEKAARERRNIVLYRMREVGYITEDEYNRARQAPVKLNVAPQVNNNDSIFGYFVEEVRREAEDTFGTRDTQTAGMNIYTTLDPRAQREAVRSVRRGLHAYQDRHGKRWRANLINVLAARLANDLAQYDHPDWLGDYETGEYVYGLIMNVGAAGADVRFGDYRATLTDAGTKWAGGPPARLLKRGDLAVFKLLKVDNDKKTLEVALEQLPAVEGALVCLDSKTGEIKAMVGGYDFSRNKFNNATQAERQTGSTFKPFIYAAAVEAGYTPETVVDAGPFVDRNTGWSPKNYDGGAGGGALPLKAALQKSLNVVAVRLLSKVGLDKGAEMVRRFGLPNPMKRVLPSALGATEEPLLAMTSAFSAFPNQGMRVEPHLIRRVTNADGDALQAGEAEAKSSKVMSPYVAAEMREMLVAVVEGGTATAIKGRPELGKRAVGGKTGTVNDFTDAWFVGFTPTYATGVWIGYPGTKRSLGEGEAGGTAALPMWYWFMEKFMKGKPDDKFPKTPNPDREILARRSQLAEQMRREAAQAAATKVEDDTADDAKSAVQGDGAAPPPLQPQPQRPSTPRLTQPEGGAPRSNRDIPPPAVRERPPVKPAPAEPKKRGRNG